MCLQLLFIPISLLIILIRFIDNLKFEVSFFRLHLIALKQVFLKIKTFLLFFLVATCKASNNDTIMNRCNCSTSGFCKSQKHIFFLIAFHDSFIQIVMYSCWKILHDVYFCISLINTRLFKSECNSALPFVKRCLFVMYFQQCQLFTCIILNVYV